MPPPRKRDDAPDESVLSPEELDITEEEEVEELDEGRFVIGAEGRPKVDAGAEREPHPDDDPRGGESARSFDDLRTDAQQPDRGATGGDASDDLTGAEVKRWIGEELERTDSQYAYRIAAKTGTEISHQQLASDDIGMAFDGLLMWYAQQVGGDTAVEEALGILLAESNIRVRYPVSGMLAYLDEHDLEPDDSIADFLETVRENEGLVFPLRHRR
ncbi:MAG: hypothetical protein ABEJ76_09195 [Halanaeroarchaeum sp.]